MEVRENTKKARIRRDSVENDVRNWIIVCIFFSMKFIPQLISYILYTFKTRETVQKKFF